MCYMNEVYAQKKRARHNRVVNRIYLLLCTVFACYTAYTSVFMYDHDELAQICALILMVSVPLFAAALTYACQGDYAFFGICMVQLSIFIHVGLKCLVLASEPELGHYVFLGFDSIWAYIMVLVFATMLPVTMGVGTKIAGAIREWLRRF